LAAAAASEGPAAEPAVFPCPDIDGDGFAICVAGCTLSPGDACGDCSDLDPSVHPDRAESCNGRDDDCDGAVDEANAGGGGVCATPQPGICGAGTLVCVGGSLRCEPNLGPQAEDCDNGLDDDCDGSTDGADAGCATCDGEPWVDTDLDLVPDCRDNCVRAANSFQQDFDRDGMGDACETGQVLCDIDRSGRVDGLDLAALGGTFGRVCADPGFDRRADLTRNCLVDGEDLALLASQFGR
jgi:hypothetical protein